MIQRLLICLFVILMTNGCYDRPAGAETAAQAVLVTNRYWAENLPQVHLEHFAVEAVDLGNRWRITYYLREGGTGGPFIFDVDKKSGKIVHAEGAQ